MTAVATERKLGRERAASVSTRRQQPYDFDELSGTPIERAFQGFSLLKLAYYRVRDPHLSGRTKWSFTIVSSRIRQNGEAMTVARPRKLDKASERGRLMPERGPQPPRRSHGVHHLRRAGPARQ
jgi:hypothetical protein